MTPLVAPCQVREERMVDSLASASLTCAGARWRNMQVSMIWMVVCCQHTCCLTVINKYQTLASGVTSQRYHLRWHTPHSKRFAPSWNILEFSNRPHEKTLFETHNDISGELMCLATGRTDPTSPGRGARQPTNHSTSHLGESRFLNSF